MTEAPPARDRCGTCEGRATGYERADARIFKPRDLFELPRLCPVLWKDDRRPCPYCGGKMAWRRVYGGMYYDPTFHRAGELLATREPCPHHGWKRMRGSDRDGVLRVDCSRYACGFVFEQEIR